MLNLIFQLVAFIGSIGGIIFLLNHLQSEPYSIKLEIPERRLQKGINVFIYNQTSFTLITKLSIYVLTEKSNDEIAKVNEAISPGIPLKCITKSVINIRHDHIMDDEEFKKGSIPFKLKVVTEFTNNRIYVFRYKKLVESIFGYDPHRQEFIRYQ